MEKKSLFMDNKTQYCHDIIISQPDPMDSMQSQSKC